MEKYKIAATIDTKYAPLIIRSRMLHEQTPKSDFPLLRERGATNIDLWTDGSIYPRHPESNSIPNFRSVSDLLQFVGDGRSGLLGYVQSLDKSRLDLSNQYHLQFRLQEAERDINSMREHLQAVIHTSAEKDRLLEFTQSELQARDRLTEENRKALLDSELLKDDVRCLKEDNELLLNRLNSCIAKADEERLELEINMWIEMQISHESHEKKLDTVTSNLKRTKAMLRRRELRLQKLVKTPFGYRTIVRERKDLSQLSQKGGHTKRQLRLARSIIVPATVSNIQSANRESGSKKHLCGSKEVQIQTGKVLASMLSQSEVHAICEEPKLEAVGVKIANKYLNKVGENIKPTDILETCDRSQISHAGYDAFYKRFQSAMRNAGLGKRVNCLPNPWQVACSRKDMNFKLVEYVGEYYSLNETISIPASKKSASKEPMMVTLNEMNSFFCDVEQVQRTMVHLYGFTLAELQGKPLIFALKLDEAEIVHGVKTKRVSITVMNRALDNTIDPSSKKYFSVQSEREIWPIAAFQIPRETHQILSWVFNRTKIPALIKAQGQGQLLQVEGLGSFPVEWHLSADMKSIKCLYGLGQGPNSPQCCIYCNQTRTKAVVLTQQQAKVAMSNRKYSWSDGLFSSSVSAEPLFGEATIERWKPIFDIPLNQVHICVLHALNRMIEKIVHMHFMHVWTIGDQTLQKVAVDEMQKAVSLTGAHGGNVVIFKDQNLSGKSNNLPSKPSFSGAHAKKIFQKNPTDSSAIPRLLYVDIVNAEKNFLRKGQAKKDRLQLWQMFETLLPYFQGLRLEDGQSASDFKVRIQAFGSQYIKCFGECHVTHYVHVVVRHACYFIEKYGSLAVWSCQGMENSHHAAKTAYSRHTQHSGGKSKKSPLVQTFQHWYRIIGHRFRNQAASEAALATLPEEVLFAEAKILARRAASINSASALHTAEWRSKCIRKGSKYVPIDESIGTPPQIIEDTETEISV